MMLIIYFLLAQIPQDLPKPETREIPEDSNLEVFLVMGGILLLVVFILILRKYEIGFGKRNQNRFREKNH